MQLITRSGRFSAEYYVSNPTTGRRTRVLRATGIRDDNTRTSRRTAEEIGRKYEAEANGVHGATRARIVRRARPITLAAAYEARVRDLRLHGRPAASIRMCLYSSVHPLRYFGPERDLDRDEITSLVEYAHYALQARSPASVYRECVELRMALRAVNADMDAARPTRKEDADKSMHLFVPPLPALPPRRAVEWWLTTEQRAAMYMHIPKRWRDHYVVYCMLGLTNGELYKITSADVLPGTPPRDSAPHESNGTNAHTNADVITSVPVDPAAPAPIEGGWAVRVRGTKNKSRDRVMPLPARVRAIILERVAHGGPGGGPAAPGEPLFEYWHAPRVALNAAARLAGVVPMGYRYVRGKGEPERAGSERAGKDATRAGTDVPRVAARAPERGTTLHKGGVTRPLRPWARVSRALPWSVNVNVLRASFCTELVLKNVHSKKIAALMGHADTTMVDRVYARMSAGDLGEVVDLIADVTAPTTKPRSGRDAPTTEPRSGRDAK